MFLSIITRTYDGQRMQKIVNNLIKTIASSNTCNKEALKEFIVNNASSPELIYKKDYPVALINKNREIQRNKATVRNVDIVALNNDTAQLNFVAKREQDFWKRLTSVDHIEAMISLQSVSENECKDDFITQSLKQSDKHQWSVETRLRDAMRANKENKELGVKPFIVLLCTKNTTCKRTDHIQLLLKHYFHENIFTFLSQNEKIKYYIAYNEHMSDIGMRYFYRFYN